MYNIYIYTTEVYPIYMYIYIFGGYLVVIHLVNRMWSIGRQCGDIMIPLQRSCSTWMLGCSNLVCLKYVASLVNLLTWDDPCCESILTPRDGAMLIPKDLGSFCSLRIWNILKDLTDSLNCQAPTIPHLTYPLVFLPCCSAKIVSGRSLRACATADALCPCGDHPPIPMPPRWSTHPKTKRGFRRRGPTFLMISFSAFSAF
jgi:hypothetical protein